MGVKQECYYENSGYKNSLFLFNFLCIFNSLKLILLEPIMLTQNIFSFSESYILFASLERIIIFKIYLC